MNVYTKIIEDGRFWLVIKWHNKDDFIDAKEVVDWIVDEVGKENYDRGPSGGYFGMEWERYDDNVTGRGFDTFILSMEDGMAFKLRWT